MAVVWLLTQGYIYLNAESTYHVGVLVAVIYYGVNHAYLIAPFGKIKSYGERKPRTGIGSVATH